MISQANCGVAMGARYGHVRSCTLPCCAPMLLVLGADKSYEVNHHGQ